jgi:hypothetical protein
MVGRCVALLVGTALWLAAGSVRAQQVDDATRGAARTLGYDGVRAYNAGDYAVADQKLDKAYRALKAPSLGLWSARTLVKLGRLVEASERYREVTRLETAGGDQAVQKQAQTDAEAELDALTPRIPSLVVELEGATPEDTTVSIDGVALAAALVGERRPANPGKHSVLGRRGADEARSEVTLAEGDQKSVRLVFMQKVPGTAPTPLTEPAPPVDDGETSGASQRLIGWISLGAGGVGLALGSTFGVLALSKHSDLEDGGSCRGDQCLRTVSDDVDSLRTQRTVSTVGFIAGAALAATGVVLVLTAPRDSESPRSAIRLGPNAVSFEERF